jgi:elongation factor P
MDPCILKNAISRPGLFGHRMVSLTGAVRGHGVSALIEAIDIKRKMFFEYEDAPFHCLDVEISKPTARGGQTLVRLKMRNLLTRAVFDKTFKAGDKFREPDLVVVSASYLYADSAGYHFMDQESFDTLTLSQEIVGQDRDLLVDNILVQVQKYNGRPIGVQFPPHVELTVASTEPGVRGDTASGGVTKLAVLETGLEIRVPLFIKEGERVKVHADTREFAGRA